MLLWRKADAGKVPLTFSSASTFALFPTFQWNLPSWCWTSTNVFYLLVYVQVNTLQFFPDCMKEGLGRFAGFCWFHSLQGGVSACYQMWSWAKLLLVPWHMVLGSADPTEVPLLGERSDLQLLRSRQVFIAMIMMSLFWNFTYHKTYFYGVYFRRFFKKLNSLRCHLLIKPYRFQV